MGVRLNASNPLAKGVQHSGLKRPAHRLKGVRPLSLDHGLVETKDQPSGCNPTSDPLSKDLA